MLISNVEGLPEGSNKKIDAICDFCEKEVKISYKLYNRSYSKGNKFSCSRKCAYEKRKEILLLSEGVENPSQLDEIKEKRKKTNLDRFGVEHAFQSEIIKIKIKETTIKKYGVDNYTKTDGYKERVKETNLKKWGVEWALQSEEIKEKSKKTNLKKYGVEKASQSEQIKEKTKKTNLESYGYVSPMMSEEIQEKAKKTLRDNWSVDNPMKSDEIKEKTKKTNLEKYGYKYPIKNEDIKNIRKERNIIKWGTTNNTSSEEFRKGMIIGSDKDYLEYLGNKISLFKCGKGHNFELHTDNYFSRKREGITLCTICYPINKAISIKEKQIYDFINSIYDEEIIESYRNKLEIDIYLPKLKLGFEFNGLYWHSSDKKPKSYHLDKTEYFKSKGIRIIHIWEDDWDYKKEIIKSMIKNHIGKTNNKIYARNCKVKEIKDVKSVRKFLDNNHIQGFTGSKIKLGLYYNNELVSIMIFDKNEGRKKLSEKEWNLSRFCNKINTNIVGGASKLLSYFINNNSCTRIISYADHDWSLGELYYKLGFVKLNNTDPDYKYLIEDKRIHKSRFRKSYTGVSESNLNIPKIYDCGKVKFELNINQYQSF